MAYQDTDFPITSRKSLISTVRVDSQVRRWFLYLLMQPGAQKDLLQDRRAQTGYAGLKRALYAERITLMMLFIALMVFLISKRSEYGILIAVLAGITVLLQMRKRDCTITLSGILVERDFDASGFAQKTLYQIGEHYSGQYHVVSLVNAITSVDVVTRKAVLYTMIFATFIYPLGFWQICGAVLGAYYIFYGLVSSAFIYRRTI